MTDRDWIHLGLSILGCIPVVGIAANIANAVLYFQEGDALNGLLSVAGALIGVGGVTAAIGAAKGICALTTVGQAIKTAGVAYTAGASAMQTIEAASKTFNMLKENDFLRKQSGHQPGCSRRGAQIHKNSVKHNIRSLLFLHPIYYLSVSANRFRIGIMTFLSWSSGIL